MTEKDIGKSALDSSGGIDQDIYNYILYRILRFDLTWNTVFVCLINHSILYLIIVQLELLDNVDLRFALAETDQQLEKNLDIFLGPVLLKLENPAESVREKVWWSLSISIIFSNGYRWLISYLVSAGYEHINPS